MSLSDLPKLLRTSVKPVHRSYLCTGFTLLRSLIILICLTMTWFSKKMLISTRCIRGLMPNLIKQSWTDSIFRLYQLWRVNSQIFQSFFFIPPPQIKSRWKCSTKFNDSLFNHVASWNFRRATNKLISGIYYWFPCANYSHGYR